MHAAAAIILGLVLLLPAVLVGGLFLWAARKDGEEDKHCRLSSVSGVGQGSGARR